MTLYAPPVPEVPAPILPPAIRKEWEATVIYRECGVVTEIRTYAVTLDKSSGELVATVDGKPYNPVDAARILRNAEDDKGLRLVREIRPMSASMKACLGVTA